MRRKISCLLVLTMVLSAAGSLSGTFSAEAAVVQKEQNAADSNLLAKIESTEVTPENLGIPGENHYGTKYYARNIWDMAAVDGRVLLSMGDYATNTGAVPIYYYTNDSTNRYECSYVSSRSAAGLSSEEIKRFYEIDGEIYATATDPLYYESGSYYKYDSQTNTWTDYYKLPMCVHCYDMVEYDGEVFFAGMVRATVNGEDRIVSCVQKLSKDSLCSSSSASDVDFYDMDGNKMELQIRYLQGVSGSVEVVTSPFWRVYDIFVYQGELYAAHSSTTNYTKNDSSGLFKYDKINNRFVQVSEGTDIKGFMSVTRNITNYATIIQNGQAVEPPVHYSFEDNSPIYSPLTVGQEEIYSEPICGAKISTDDTFVAVCNGIFKSSDLMTFEKVSLGTGYENYVTRDAFEKDGKYYFLASEKNGTDDFITAVFETDDNFTQFRKVLSFSTKSFARSFVYNEGYLYVGLGGNGRIDNVGDSDTSEYSGTLYRINLADLVPDDEEGDGREENKDKTEDDLPEEQNKAKTEDGLPEEQNKDKTEDGLPEEQNKTETGSSENNQSKYKPGDIIDEANARYKVLTVGKKGGTVEYIGTKNSKDKTIKIPASILVENVTYKVISVADNAVKNHKYVTKIVVGSNIKTIGKNAFKNCKKLFSVTIGTSVKTIGKEAFRGCSKLKKITIKSKKLRTIGKNAFKGINSRAKIKVPSSKLKAYKKLLKGKGQNAKVKITK